MGLEESSWAGELEQITSALTHAHCLAERLQSALATRAIIDQAIGVTMSRSGDTEVEALDRLLALSQTQHQNVAEIARAIVDGAQGWALPLTTTTTDSATESDGSTRVG